MCSNKPMLFAEGLARPFDPATEVPVDTLPHFGADHVTFLDFDGTLSNTGQVVERMGVAGEPFGLSAAAIAAARREVNEQGETFDSYGYVRDTLGDEAALASWDNRFRQAHEVDIMYPDGRRLLAGISDALSRPYAVIIHGHVAGWQATKLASGSYHGYGRILSEPTKGAEIHSYRNPQTGEYDLVGLSADATPTALVTARDARMVEDRNHYLKGVPDNCQKILVRRPGEQLSRSQTRGEVAPDTLVVSDLGQLAFSGIVRLLNDQAYEHFINLYQRKRIAAWVPLRLFNGHGGEQVGQVTPTSGSTAVRTAGAA